MSNEKSGGAARFGAAVANIARGAAAGGLYGAAVGAAKSFLPEIVKLVGVLLFLLIGLPLIIIMALPNSLFGFGSSEASDITQMNAQAQTLSDAYGNADTYTQTASDGIIADIIALFTGDYDELEVTRELGNMNEYWFKAITSVASRQELSAMDDATVQGMAKEKLASTWSIFSIFTDEEESKILKIDVRELTPDELMDKLNFTEQQRIWAGVIYETLAEEQSVGVADGDGYYGTDYGDISFTDAATEVVYYNQTDSRWGGLSYGKTGTIARSACGPTVLAIAVASLTDNAVTPDKVAKWAADNGYYVEGSGSRRSLITEGGAHYGLTVAGLGLDAQRIADALADGKLVIAIMAKGHFTSNGHFIVLRGVTSDGKILVADPASVTRSNQEWSLSLIVSEASRGSGEGGPFWSLEG
ncbi:MAG: C39 family peptidase [Oscillospiraceae bacterium]|jgi:hypothetical protein|nr:C39 family peptidase [Oscillospiraceae bacterium]